MRILGIETSCDETSAAIVEDGCVVLSNVIASSMRDHEAFHGVVPEIAARRQLEYMTPVLLQALEDAKTSWDEIDAIAVTMGPGLLTSLLVGTTAARVLASAHKKKLIGVHHTLGHLSSTWLEVARCSLPRAESRGATCCTPETGVPQFPILALSVSGGHTELWLRMSHTSGTLLGSTRDDAAGEAFDKGAMLLGIPSPGGPLLAKLAEGGNPHFVDFPQPLSREDTCEFSFSGLKTSLKYHLRDRGGIEVLSEEEKKDVAASFQEAINLHLTSRINHALDLHEEIREIHLVGGVSANKRLREMMSLIGERHAVPLRVPQKMAYCTDNAAMIAAAGYFLLQEAPEHGLRPFVTSASIALELMRTSGELLPR